MQSVDIHPSWIRRRFCARDHELPVGTGVALLSITGDVVIHGKDSRTFLNSGDMIVADRTRPFRLEGDCDWSADALFLEDRRIEEYVGRQRHSELIRCGDTGGLAEAMRSLWIAGDRLSQTGADDRLIGMALVDLVTRLSIRMVVDVTEARAPTHVVDTVERARALIRAHLADHRFGVSELARRMRLSPRHLSSLFAPFGTTTARAILEMRIARSRELLADPVNRHRQIVDIALACGFEDQNYFSRCFRAIVGRSPRDFRNDRDFSDRSLAHN